MTELADPFERRASSALEPVDLFEKRASLALIVAGYFQMPVETALGKSTDALEGLANTAMRDVAHQLRQRVWRATQEANEAKA